MKITLTEQQKAMLQRKVITLFLEDFDEEISDFKADQILDAFIEKLGPSIYNAAIEDMKLFMMQQLEDLEAIYQKE